MQVIKESWFTMKYLGTSHTAVLKYVHTLRNSLLRNFAVFKYKPARHVTWLLSGVFCCFSVNWGSTGAPVIIWVVLNRDGVNSQDLFGLQQILKARNHSDVYFYSCLLFIFLPRKKDGEEIKRRSRREKRDNSLAKIYF